MTRAIFAVFFTLWALVVLVPMAALVVWPFLGFEDFQFTLPPTLDAISQVMASGRYEVTLRTIRIVLTVTALELVVALPFAIWLARSVRSARRKSLVLAALTIPFFLSLASRTIIWRAVLGNTGLVNLVLLKLGLVQEPVGWLLFSEFAVHLGLLAPAFPTMAVPIYLAISLIDNEAIEAAGDLGAGPWRTFVDVILPLAVPGIIAGIIFTSVPILGDTVVPGLLGGGQVSMLGPSMTSLLGVLNYPVASALGLVVLLILGFLLLLARRFGGGQFSLGQIFEELGR